jgi:type VII secretion integral membrane protein EccD
MLDRRLDVAVPDDVALAELVPAMVRHAGEHLADAGAAHGGWMLRRADGAALSGAKNLTDQGVRDGDVLALVRADAAWPEPEYDDIVDAIAVARKAGQPWDGAATRRAAVVTAVTALAAGLVALAHASTQGAPGAALIAAGLSAVLLGYGVVASRAAGDAGTGVVCGALAMPYAFVVGLLVSRGVPTQLLIGSVAAVVVGLLAVMGVGRVSPVLVGGVGAGLIGMAGSIVARSSSPTTAAGVVLAAMALSIGLVPVVAIRVTGLARWQIGGDIDRVIAAVARTDDVIVGLFLGIALATAWGATLIALAGNGWARWLGAACVGALVLRARAYASVRQRVAAIAAGAAPALPLLAAAVWAGQSRPTVAAGFAVVGLLIIVARAVARPAPYLSRAGDLVEAVCTVSVLPLLCGALGLYARLRALT